MSFQPKLQPSTWRTLGLYVSASYIALGTIPIFLPTISADIFGLLPENTPEEEVSPTLTTSLRLLGARDYTLGVAILSLWAKQDNDGMGRVILSGMVVCAADVYVVWKLKGARDGVFLGVGALLWGCVGMGLIGYWE